MTVETIVEYLEAVTWVKAVLTDPPIDDVPGGVQEHPATELGEMPVITMAQQAWTDESEVSEHRVWSEILLLVTVITKGESTLAIGPAAREIDRRLHRASGVTDNAQIISCARRGGFNNSSVENGDSYRRLGGFYSVLVQPTNP